MEFTSGKEGAWPGLQNPQTLSAIRALIESVGGDPDALSGRLIADQIINSLKLLHSSHDPGQLKLITRALKEMRYAYRVFNRYRGIRKISIFGSARTPEDHADYQAARAFSAAIAQEGWMSITGAGDGIMKAGHEGPQRDASFGLSIRLPFETTANTVIEGDPKLINFRYFFTRKLMFLTHSDAVAVFPGGFGTQDELFEVLTLVQTGKSNMIPVVLIEGAGGEYWRRWDWDVRENLLRGGFISPEDPCLYRIALGFDQAVEEVLGFYRVYHSSRYVGEQFVIRLTRPLTDEQVAALNDEFGDLVREGRIVQSGPLAGEDDHPELPRLAMAFTRNRFGRLRMLIDRINGFALD